MCVCTPHFNVEAGIVCEIVYIFDIMYVLRK